MWLCLWEGSYKGGEGWATQSGANKVWGGGKWVVFMCLSFLIMWAAWKRLSWWLACHGPVTLSHTIVAVWDWWGAATGWLRAAGEQEEEEMRRGRRKRKRTQVADRDARQKWWGSVRLCRTSKENQVMKMLEISVCRLENQPIILTFKALCWILVSAGHW